MYSYVVSRCYQQFFWYRYFAGIRFIWRSVWYFRSVLLIRRELLFSAKGGLAVSKRGLFPPFSSKRRPLPPFRGKQGFPPKKSYRNVPPKISFGIDMVNTEKYRQIPTGKYRFGIQLQKCNNSLKQPPQYPPIDTPLSPPIVGIAGQTNILSDPPFHVGHDDAIHQNIIDFFYLRDIFFSNFFFGECFFLLWDVEWDRMSVRAIYLQNPTIKGFCF